jgi:hypothetical protein
LSSQNLIVLNQNKWLEPNILSGTRLLGLKQIVLLEW